MSNRDKRLWAAAGIILAGVLIGGMTLAFAAATA